LGALPSGELWWRYVELGGQRSRAELNDYLAGATAWTGSEHNALAQALNEDLWESGHPSLAPYREPRDDRNVVTAEIDESWHETP
jgi:hypothetical protein